MRPWAVDQIMADNSQVHSLVEAGPIVMGTLSADQRVRAELFGGFQWACHASGVIIELCAHEIGKTSQPITARISDQIDAGRDLDEAEPLAMRIGWVPLPRDPQSPTVLLSAYRIASDLSFASSCAVR